MSHYYYHNTHKNSNSSNLMWCIKRRRLSSESTKESESENSKQYSFWTHDMESFFFLFLHFHRILCFVFSLSDEWQTSSMSPKRKIVDNFPQAIKRFREIFWECGDQNRLQRLFSPGSSHCVRWQWWLLSIVDWVWSFMVPEVKLRQKI